MSGRFSFLIDFIDKILSIECIYGHRVSSKCNAQTKVNHIKVDEIWLFNRFDYVAHITHNIPKNSHMYDIVL